MRTTVSSASAGSVMALLVEPVARSGPGTSDPDALIRYLVWAKVRRWLIGTKRVVLTFNAACWVDVRDSERKFKLFGEMPKGERKCPWAGQPPYKW